MNKENIAKLALMGLMAGGLVTGCSSKTEKPDEMPAESKPAESTPEETTTPEAPAESGEMASDAAQYSELHDCAGKNACKGLGGCKVSAEKLTELAAAAGVPADKAGEAHECGGMNNCKGLGGCHVDADKLAMLKAKLAK